MFDSDSDSEDATAKEPVKRPVHYHLKDENTAKKEMVRLSVIHVKVSRIIPKFRILRLTFSGKSASKYLIRHMIIVL